MLLENMKMAFHAIRVNKMRSFLTMLGIIIGIGSVISIVSIGDTMRSLFSSLYKDVGLSQAYISIGYWIEDVRDSDYFTMDELDRLKEIFGDRIAYIDSAPSISGEVKAGGNKLKFNLSGVDYNYQNVQPVNMIYGRYLTEEDVKARKQVAVMEAGAAKKIYGTEQAVGRTFRTEVYGSITEFTLVGVYKKEVNAFQKLLMGSSDDTGAAFVPWTLLTWPNDLIYSCRLFADPGMSREDMNQLFQEIMFYIAKSKGRNSQDFRLTTAMDEMVQVDSVMGGLSAAVGGIAAISLLVGGIGIMNIMLVSVTERTREIGIRKALGATTRDVLIQFLTESAILSACGGTIGIILGIGVVFVGGSALGLQVVVKPAVVLLAVTFSAMVGIFFGIYPASKAAKADPIEALRYE